MKLTDKWIYLTAGAALILANFAIWEGWLPNATALINLLFFGGFAFALFFSQKYFNFPGLEKTRQSAKKFYKEIVFGEDKIGVNVIDIEGVEKIDRKEKKTTHSFLLDVPHSADPQTAFEIILNPSSNPHPRLVGYRRGVVYESLVPMRSKLIEKEKEAIAPKPKKEQQKLDIRVKQEEKKTTEAVK